MLELILFYTFGTIAVVSAILVITRHNVVHSAAFLGATLFAVAGIFLTLRAEFLAGVQVIVYVGGNCRCRRLGQETDAGGRITAHGNYISLFIARSGAVYDRRYRRSDSPEHHDHPDVDRVDDERGEYQPDRVFSAFAAGDRSGLRDFCDHRGCGRSRGWSRDRNRDVQEQRDDEHQRDRSDEVVSE